MLDNLENIGESLEKIIAQMRCMPWGETGAGDVLKREVSIVEMGDGFILYSDGTVMPLSDQQE